VPRRAALRCAAPIPEDLEQNIKAAVKFGFSGLVSVVRADNIATPNRFALKFTTAGEREKEGVARARGSTNDCRRDADVRDDRFAGNVITSY